MKVALAQTNPIIGDFEYNLNKIDSAINQAKERSCDLIVFSELMLPGYPPRDLLEKNRFIESNLICLDRLLASTTGIGVICGYVEKNLNPGGNPLYNSAALFENGRMLHVARKRLLPAYDIFDERRYFEPARDCSSIKYKGYRIGLTICEDVWNDKDVFQRQIYPIDPVDLMVKDGANLIINISASPFYVGKRDFRLKMLSRISQKYGVCLLYANQVGGNDSILFDGNSCAFNTKGELIAQARDFEEDLVVVDLEKKTGDVHEVSDSEMASLEKSLVIGTRDYVTKCGFSKAIIGLSGGIDSALTACIAVSALGAENVTTLFMPSEYTSQDNFEDTKCLADNLGVQFLNIPIHDIFMAFIKFISPEFNPREPGVTEQNLQARIRGTLLMAMSNRDGALLLSTGNKSELAMGYCTLYGDMNGGLAVISDVPKTMVYDLARFINTQKETIPLSIIEKPPSAELKPDQTDQDDLPPYELLDPVLKAYIEDFKGADDLVGMGFDPKLVGSIISRVDQNEYKRHQAPPGLKVTSKAFGYGRRYPLAQRYAPFSEKG